MPLMKPSPRPEIVVPAKAYGRLLQLDRPNSARSRLFAALLFEGSEDHVLRWDSNGDAEELFGGSSHGPGPYLILATNDPKTGNPTRELLGRIDSLRIDRLGWNASVISEGSETPIRVGLLVSNSCCGTGAVGQAGPVASRHREVGIRSDDESVSSWLEVTT